MGKGVVYKNNGTTWSKSIVKDTGNTTSIVWDDGLIKHYGGTTWYNNYPMEQIYTQSFNATWSQGWKGDGVRLDDGVWKGNILVGSTTNFRGMLGFSQTAIASFIGSGVVQSARLHINCYETTLNGAPDVQFGKHSYTAKPTGTWNGATNTDWGAYSSLHVNNGATGGYWVTLNAAQIRMSNGAALGGIAFRAEAATDENHGKFSGVSSYASQLEITVLK